jgi:putative oxidoreductase
MNDIHAAEQALEDYGKLLLRALVAGLMLFHGVDKVVHGPGHVMQDLVEHGLPAAMAYGVYLGEVVAPLLIIAGIWTRIAALVYSGSMAFATLLVHFDDFVRLHDTGAWGAELWAFYIVAPLAVALLGPGRFALRRRPFPWD